MVKKKKLSNPDLYSQDNNLLKIKNVNLIKLIIILISTILTVYLVASTILKQSICKLETSNIQKDFERIIEIIATQTSQLEITTYDYGNWNDTYRFAQNLEDDYLKINFTSETFRSLNIDLVFLVNNNKTIIKSRFYDHRTGKITDLTTQTVLFNAIAEQLKHLATSKLYSNYIFRENKLILYSLTPVLDSKRQGPARGFLGMASILDKEDEIKISRITNINFEIESLESGEIPSEVLLKIKNNKNKIATENISDKLLNAYGLLQDKEGKSLAGIKIADTRIIYQNALLGLNYLKQSLIVVGIIFLIISKKFLNNLEKEIKQRQEVENLLKKEQQLAYTTFDSITDGIILTDAQEKVIFLNPVAETLTGWRNDQAVGQALELIYQVIKSDDWSETKENYQGEENSFFEVMGEKVLISRQGIQYAINESIAAIKENGNPSGSVVVFKDVTKIRQMAYQLARQATYDPLTELLNRPTFEVHLKRALTQAKQQKLVSDCLGLIDLDHFKYVNDTCGHQGGDKVLHQISEIFKTNIPCDHTIARLGGDEFGVIFLNCTILEAQAIAIKLCNEVGEFRFYWGNQVFRVGASIGLVAITPEASTIEMLLTQADMACYEAKEKGRGRVEVYGAANLSH